MDIRAEALRWYTEIADLGQYIEENQLRAMQCGAIVLLAMHRKDEETATIFLAEALGHQEVVVRIRKLQRLARLLMPLTARLEEARSQSDQTVHRIRARSLALLYKEIARNAPFN